MGLMDISERPASGVPIGEMPRQRDATFGGMSDPLSPTPLPPELAAELEALAETLALRTDHADLARKLEWLIDALVLRGQLPPTFKKLATKIRGDRSSVRLAMFRDKYAVPSAE